MNELNVLSMVDVASSYKKNNKEMLHHVSETHNLIFVEIYENGICCEMAQIVAGSKFILDGYHNCTQLYVQDRNM